MGTSLGRGAGEGGGSQGESTGICETQPQGLCHLLPPPRCAAGSWGSGDHPMTRFPLFSAPSSTACSAQPRMNQSLGALAGLSVSSSPTGSDHFHQGWQDSIPDPARSTQPPVVGEEGRDGHWPAFPAPPGYLLVPGQALSSHISSPSQGLATPPRRLSKVYSSFTHCPRREKETPCFPSSLMLHSTAFTLREVLRWGWMGLLHHTPLPHCPLEHTSLLCPQYPAKIAE